MLEASRAPASPDLTMNRFGLETRLVNYLLKSGERESVVEFLERAARINGSRKEAMLNDAASIHEGRMPIAYQHMMARQ
jgi:hypothetical protein